MATMTPERTDQLVIDLRRGLDLDGLENPAGGLFTGDYTPHEISMTGGGGEFTVNYDTNISYQDYNCPPAYCCMI